MKAELGGIVVTPAQYAFLMALADLMRDAEWKDSKRDAIIRTARACFEDGKPAPKRKRRTKGERG